MSPDGYLSGQEVGSGHPPMHTDKPGLRHDGRIPAGRPPAKAQPGPKVPVVHQSSTRYVEDLVGLSVLPETGLNVQMGHHNLKHCTEKNSLCWTSRSRPFFRLCFVHISLHT